MFGVLLTVCLLVFIFATIYWRARLVESRAHPLPPAFPGILPIIGHTHLLVDSTNLWPLLKKISEYSLQHGGVIYGKFGSQIYYAISDPEDALLVANTCLEKHFLYGFIKYWLGEGLITGSGAHWYRHRQMLKSSFGLPIINGFIEVFNSQSRALLSDIDHIKEKEIFYPTPYLKKFALGTSYYVPYQPLLDMMLEHTRNPFTDQEITEELHTAIAAAFDTTSHSLDTILVMIGSFPKVQESMFEEIMQVLGADRDVAKEDLKKLIFTEAVIKESLRLFTTAPVIVRSIDRDVKLKKNTLRAGSQCLLLLHGLHRHPSWGPDADQFRPERWLDTATLPTDNITDAAFSFGKRSCLGKIYAMTSMKIAVAHMVRRYIITADHTKMQYHFNFTLNAVSGHEITLERRS